MQKLETKRFIDIFSFTNNNKILLTNRETIVIEKRSVFASVANFSLNQTSMIYDS